MQNLPQGRGNILMPVNNLIFFLDLIDVFRSKLLGNSARGLSDLKIVIMSEGFPHVTAQANAYLEYLNPVLQKKIISKRPELPLSSL